MEQREQDIQSLETYYLKQYNKLMDARNNYLQQFKIRWTANKHLNYCFRLIHCWHDLEQKRLDNIKGEKLRIINSKYGIGENTKKYAVLVGINYVDTGYELRGCVNDVEKLQGILMNKYDYHSENIKTILNSNATNRNILYSFEMLLKNAQPGDTIFFSFSGHGTFIKDFSGDERDHRDEILVTSDFKYILDDHLKVIIDSSLKPHVTLYAVFDNCYGGTMLDLKYHYYNTDTNTENKIVNSNSNITPGHVICLTGCRDNQVAMDAYIKNEFNGAFVCHLVNILNNNENLTWKTLLQNVRDSLQENDFHQMPQITCGREMNLYELDATF
jgi:metacaspase-1